MMRRWRQVAVIYDLSSPDKSQGAQARKRLRRQHLPRRWTCRSDDGRAHAV